MHVCLCTWKFYHLMCVFVSVVPDLREGLMGTCCSNVGLLLIMSQNNLSKNLHPFFKGQCCFPRGMSVHACVQVFGCVKECWVLLCLVQQHHNHNSRNAVKQVCIKSFKRHISSKKRKKEKKLGKKFRLTHSSFPQEHVCSKFWVTHRENYTPVKTNSLFIGLGQRNINALQPIMRFSTSRTCQRRDAADQRAAVFCSGKAFSYTQLMMTSFGCM